MLNFFKL